MRSSLTLAISAMGLLALAACGNPPAAPPQGPAAVTVAVPLRERVVDWDDFTGRFEAPERVEFSYIAFNPRDAKQNVIKQFERRHQYCFVA